MTAVNLCLPAVSCREWIETLEVQFFSDGSGGLPAVSCREWIETPLPKIGSAWPKSSPGSKLSGVD